MTGVTGDRDLVLTLRGEPPVGDGVYAATRPIRGVEAVTVTRAVSGGPVPGAHVGAAEVVSSYVVETVHHWDDGIIPGVVRFAFVAPLPAIDVSEFRRRYEGHAAIARVQHPGICRYVQHFVVDGSEPVCAAIAELHFADETAMRERFYRDADSPAVVDADIDDYLDRARTWSVLARPVTAT